MAGTEPNAGPEPGSYPKARPRGSFGPTPGPLPVRLLWFAALWLAGVAAVGLVALLIRTALT